MGDVRVLFETSDAARALDRAASTVLHYVRTQKLRPVAITPSGRRLYDPGDVAVLREQLFRGSDDTQARVVAGAG
jgi:DNA-binding transcriptional MerR regulator